MEKEELQRSFSPPPCPASVTVRRNPPRKARATPFTTAAKPPSASLTTAANSHEVPSFPIDEILSIQIQQPEPKPSVSESLKIFLRVKPLKVFSKVITTKSRPRNVWPQNPSKKRNPEKEKSKKIEEACIALNDPYSVTLTPPQALQELKRSKTEVYEGFSHVFPADCSQNDVYDKMVQPLLEDFMKGKSGMLAALGPSGSGKTHTVFGTPKDPGIVPLTLRQIFKKSDEASPVSLRLFYLSIFEIYSERGKGEKAYDLLGDGSSELSVQQSTIRGLKEVTIRTLEEAETLIGQAMLKRATATTNSNSQSSRSQCIINIRAASDGVSNDTKMQSSDAMLTIVDLAGAEREKRTGNQGERLVESNFINNTSMVFGQCLRSLLEYQKNRKKGLQKHYQNSLLTRYLRDYLEGKKRMALILTVKAGEEDYLDTSCLLKQASPYMKIKFDNTEEPCNKRQLKTFPRVEKNKKMKLSAPKISPIEEIVAGERNQISQEVNLKGKKADPKEKLSARLKHVTYDNNEREHIIMRNFAKVLWNVLKQYNEKLKVSEGDICSLKESLRSEQLKSRGLETELINLKSSCLFSKPNLAEPCMPEVEALVQAKEQFEVDTCLAIAVSNVDDDPRNLIESKRAVSIEGCNESPVPNKSAIPGLGNEEISCDEQKCVKQGDPTPSPEQVEVCRINNESRRVVSTERCNESHVPNKSVVPGLGNEEISCDEQKCGKQGDPTPSPEQVEVSRINNESRREVSTEGCNESPVPNKSVVPGLGNEEISRDEQKCAKQSDPTPSPEQVEVSRINNGLSNIQTKGCIESPVPNKSVVPGLGNEEISCNEQNCAKQYDPTPSPKQGEVCRINNESRRVVSTEGCNESPVPNRSVVPGLGNEGISCDEQKSAKQGDPTPSPEQVEVSHINNGLSNIQTKSAISRRFPDSEKQKRHRRLLPASSTSLAEEMDDLDIKDNQIEKPQVKFAKTRVQEKSESTQGREIEIPALEAEPASTKKQRNGQKKPKRRLQPASSVLLTREINTLEIEDDVAEPKGTRGGKKTTTAQPRSQGSVTLLRLLTNNLHL